MTCVCAGGREFKHLAESESFWAQCRCRMAIKRKVLFVSRLLVSRLLVSSFIIFLLLLLVLLLLKLPVPFPPAFYDIASSQAVKTGGKQRKLLVTSRSKTGPIGHLKLPT